MSDAQNTTAAEAWNTVLFDKFRRFRKVVTQGLSDHSDEVLRRWPYPSAARVLDIGCGFGDTTQKIAKQIGEAGAAVGVDFAKNFVDAAMQEAIQSGLQNASFFVADVQSDDLRGPYDYAFSRFGTMFFDLPEVALRNIRHALKPGAYLTMIVWRRREDNPWLHDAECLVRTLLAVPRVETLQPHYAPGPFSMENPETVSDRLTASGFERVSFERYDTSVCIGGTIDEAVEFAMTLGPAGEIIRLAGEEGVRRAMEIAAALRTQMAPHSNASGVWCGSSSWFVRARNPHVENS